MARSNASRKYQLTINNPAEHGFTHEVIKSAIVEMSGCLYWCLCDEIGGDTRTYHTHVYMAFANAKEFSAIQRRFYGAHIELARGTHRENRDYIRKEGKWSDDVKHETNLRDTFEESGPLPEETTRQQKQSEAILGMVTSGASNAEILRDYPSAMNHLPRIEQARQTLLAERFRKEFRYLHVTYLSGPAGVGKTRMVMERHGYENVYRVTDYEHPFDNYAGEDVLLLDEFRSSLTFSLLLNVLDGYPMQLPCRYANKQACFTVVYLVSNIPLQQQYPNVQISEPQSFKALERRIHEVLELLPGDDPDMPF